MESGEVVAKTCSRCGENYASKDNAWCRKCRSAHELARQATQLEMVAAKNWAAGVRAFRQQIAHVLAQRPGYTVECTAVAKWIMDFPAPKFEEKKAPPAEAGGVG